MEISTFRRERAGRREREREDVPPSLPVPGSPVSIPPSNLSPSPLARLIFQLWQPFIKNRFQKALLPSDGIPYKSSGRNAPSDTEYPLPSRLSADIHTLNLQWKHAHANTNISISTHLPPHLVCSRCHCRCPWAGSRCRSPGWECCCYSRDYTARGGNWKKKRLRLGCSNLLGNYYTKERKFSSN